MKPVTYNLPAALTDRIGEVARDSERSKSFVVRKLLEQSLNGVDRLAALQAIADKGLADFEANAVRERMPNPAAVIAKASVDGHARLSALKRIAKAAK